MELMRPVEALAGVGGRDRRRSYLAKPPYWLITGRAGVREVLTLGSESVLPVFGSEASALEFLRWYGGEDRLAPEPATIGDLLLLLDGARTGVTRVALDPSSEILVEQATALVSLSRQSFVDFLLGRGNTWFRNRYARR